MDLCEHDNAATSGSRDVREDTHRCLKVNSKVTDSECQRRKEESVSCWIARIRIEVDTRECTIFSVLHMES